MLKTQKVHSFSILAVLLLFALATGCKGFFVNPTLSTLTVGPTTPHIQQGTTLQMAATGTYNDGSTKDLTRTAFWSTSDSTIASVNASGLVTGVSPRMPSEELARRIGRSRPQISNTIRLLNLPAPVQLRVAAGVLSAGHARALLSLEGAEQQEVLATRIIAEGMSVRATEEAVALALAEGAPAKKTAAKRARPHAPGLSDLAERLSDHFETRVRVDIGRRKGRIQIEFATVDDLERIVAMIGPPPAREGD